MISLDFQNNKLIVRVLKGPKFIEDLGKLKTISSKKPIYVDNYFSHWEFATFSFGEIKRNFGESIILTPDAKGFLDNYSTALKPIKDLDPITDEISFFREPKFKEQEDYIRINRSKEKIICALVPGLGKTYISLMRAEVLGFEKLVIIAPKSTMTNWKTEIRKTFDENCTIYHGTVKQRAAIDLEANRIIVTSYSMVKELNLAADSIIIDESHMLAHAATKTYKEVKKFLDSNPKAKIQLLTGTPILHKVADLWTLVNIVSPEVSGSFQDWKNRYELILQSIKKEIYLKDRTGKYLKDEFGQPKKKRIEIPIKTRPQNLDELSKRIEPVLVRVKRDKFVSFKDSVEIITVPMSVRQQELYSTIRKDVLLELETKKLSIPNALSELTRLLQCAEGSFNIESTWIDSGKLEYLFDLLENTEEKFIVWSRFKPISKILGEKFKETSVLFNGDLTPSQRKLAVWDFQGVETKEDAEEWKTLKSKFSAPGEAQFFFGVIDRATSVGMNLQACSNQIITSYPWNGNVLVQTTDRIKRLSQEAEEVNTTFLVSENTMEEYALQLILNNQKICVNILDGENSVSYNQIMDLLKNLKEKK